MASEPSAASSPLSGVAVTPGGTLVERSALVMVPAARVYELVRDVRAYPARFNWCEAATVHLEDEARQRASLAVRIAGISASFTTDNRLLAPHSIEMQLVDGPFRSLNGLWRFESLSERGARVSLRLAFEVANGLMAGAIKLGFAHLADRMVDDFCRQARLGDG